MFCGWQHASVRPTISAPWLSPSSACDDRWERFFDVANCGHNTWEKLTTSFTAKGGQSFAIATPIDVTDNTHLGAAPGESISIDGRFYRSSRRMLSDLKATTTKLRNGSHVNQNRENLKS
jgi:hypothetical protein